MNRKMFDRIAVVAIAGALVFGATAHADLIHHWTMEEGTGTTTADAVGSENGTLEGGVTWETANLPPFVQGGTTAATAFDGQSGTRITMNGFEGITGTGARTVAFWMNAAEVQVLDAATMVSWGTTGTSSGTRFDVRINSVDQGTENALRLEVEGGFIIGETVVTDGQWRHVAVTWDPDDGLGVHDAKLYINGILEDNVTQSDTNQSIDTGNAEDFRLGASILGGVNERNFTGLMDDVRLYDRALSASEIQALVVPEPGSWLLLISALACGLLVRRRRGEE